jgi:hypothetical protein
VTFLGKGGGGQISHRSPQCATIIIKLIINLRSGELACENLHAALRAAIKVVAARSPHAKLVAIVLLFLLLLPRSGPLSIPNEEIGAFRAAKDGRGKQEKCVHICINNTVVRREKYQAVGGRRRNQFRVVEEGEGYQVIGGECM